mmetsp:Transcript_50120/g.145336  ORF Transcript_50120/g.145336 Transcript_50120/m.145336 type:complete len:222 (+) Transcript_50120:1004-1669(+)
MESSRLRRHWLDLLLLLLLLALVLAVGGAAVRGRGLAAVALRRAVHSLLVGLLVLLVLTVVRPHALVRLHGAVGGWLLGGPAAAGRSVDLGLVPGRGWGPYSPLGTLDGVRVLRGDDEAQAVLSHGDAQHLRVYHAHGQVLDVRLGLLLVLILFLFLVLLVYDPPDVGEGLARDERAAVLNHGVGLAGAELHAYLPLLVPIDVDRFFTPLHVAGSAAAGVQ